MRTTWILLLAVAALLSTSCAEPEQQLMDTFFDAVQDGDEARMTRVSLAKFEGNVVSWEIIESGPESESPFQLAALEAELEELEDEVDAQRDANRRFTEDNRETYEAYKNKYAEDPNAPFQGELLAFHEELQERLGRQGQLEADADQLSLDIEALRDAAALSLSTNVTGQFEGPITAKALRLRVNDGSEEKTYTFVLNRYDLVDPQRNITPNARWIIADIEEQA